MIPHNRYFKRIASEQSGTTVLEFALILPTFMVMLMGIFDLGYSVYVRAVLDGAVQRAARDSSLETGPNSLVAIDLSVEKSIRAISNKAVVATQRQSYFEFADVNRAETIIEVNSGTNSTGVCDAGETFEDENGNDQWDSDVGEEGVGGPQDIVLYTVNVTYDRIFPLYRFANQPQSKTITAQTVLRNQPYGSQAQVSNITIEPCDVN
jgi:Flp pilus assembly protein TadG